MLNPKELSGSFNTASGKCCCNVANDERDIKKFIKVSIPQAVGAVATN